MQVGDWEEALTKFKVSQAEESLALANAKEASIENRAMSLAEGWCCLYPGLPTCATYISQVFGGEPDISLLQKSSLSLSFEKEIPNAGGRGLRQSLTPQAQRALIRSGSKRAEALETLTAQVAELQHTLQVTPPSLLQYPPVLSDCDHACSLYLPLC